MTYLIFFYFKEVNQICSKCKVSLWNMKYILDDLLLLYAVISYEYNGLCLKTNLLKETSLLVKY